MLYEQQKCVGVCCNVQCWPCFHPLYISLIQIISHTKEDHSIIRGLPNYVYRGERRDNCPSDIICWIEKCTNLQSGGGGEGELLVALLWVIRCITWHQVQAAPQWPHISNSEYSFINCETLSSILSVSVTFCYTGYNDRMLLYVEYI